MVSKANKQKGPVKQKDISVETFSTGGMKKVSRSLER